jgi:rhodanese-related sulfurtransferase
MKSETVDGATLETWDVDEVSGALARRDIVLVDVRSPQEFMIEHIEGALLSPIAFFDPSFLPRDTDRRIVLHCGSGMRSEKAARACLEAGFERIAHLGGGMAAWKAGGQPFVGTDMATGAPKRITAA